MSLSTDLASAFAELELTVPLLFGALEARGFVDRSAAVESTEGVQIQHSVDVLYLQRDTASALALVIDDEIRIGDPGALSAVGSPLFVIRDISPMDDGMILRVIVAQEDA